MWRKQVVDCCLGFLQANNVSSLWKIVVSGSFLLTKCIPKMSSSDEYLYFLNMMSQIYVRFIMKVRWFILSWAMRIPHTYTYEYYEGVKAIFCLNLWLWQPKWFLCDIFTFTFLDWLVSWYNDDRHLLGDKLSYMI